MRGRKKWLLFSLALAAGLALGVTLVAGGDGAKLRTPDQKMPESLQKLCNLYNQLGVQKLTRSVLMKKQSDVLAGKATLNQDDVLFLEQLLGDPGDVAEMEAPLGPRKARKPFESFADPVLQGRWGNPAFDVSRGIIRATDDPRLLNSDYLKIRRAWKKGDTWHAVCEFALFKAREIAGNASLTYLALLPAPELENNLGTASTAATRLRVGRGGNWRSDRGYTGHGVIVGDVDSGVDFAHGDFLNPDGTSRFLYIWDTSAADDGNTPYDLYGFDSAFDYGKVWTKAQIDAGLCNVYDPASSGGHGTHTCGTAAGNGGATGNYTGMAPNADIIFVKGLDSWGIEFIFEMASRLGRPAVVNNSWGYSWYSNMSNTASNYNYMVQYLSGDGTDWESDYMAYLSSQYPNGYIKVKSAGNNGMWHTFTDLTTPTGYSVYDGSLHAGGTSTQGNAPQIIYHRLPHPEKFGIRSEYSRFWVRSDVPVRVTIVTAVATYTRSTGNSGAFGSPYSTHTASNMTYIDSYNGEYCGYFLFDDWNADAGWGEGDWTITVEPLNAGDTATYDMWLTSAIYRWNQAGHSTYQAYFDSCFTTNSSYEEYMLDFSSSRDIISVGSWTTRNTWLSIDGYTYRYTLWPNENTITYFSSPGPTRDGRMKPDIAAPGSAIISTLARNLVVSSVLIDPDGGHQVMSGTSMACPHATGAIALILQKYPTANTNRVRNLLSSWARNDVHTRAIGPNGFGAGKLFVLPLNDPPVALVSADKEELILDNGDKARFDGSASYDPEHFALTYAWTLVSKPSGSSPTFSGSGAAATLVPDPNVEGTYQVGLVVNDTIVDSPMAVVAVTAKGYPVLPASGFALQRLESDLVFTKEYVNRLVWQANPENKVTVVGYKLYRKAKGANDGAYALLQQLAATVFTYDDRGLAADQLYTYKLTTIDQKGRESDPAVAGN